MELVTKASVYLHNYLCLTVNAYLPSGFIDSKHGSGNIIPGGWRKMATFDYALLDLPWMAGNNMSFNASVIRNDMKDYFNSTEGGLSWQLDCRAAQTGGKRSNLSRAPGLRGPWKIKHWINHYAHDSSSLLLVVPSLS